MKLWKNLVAAVLFGACAQAWAVPVVTVDTGAGSAQVGSTVDFTVSIADVADLYTYGFDFHFDARYLRAIGSSIGGILGDGFNDPGVIDNDNGSISWLFNTLVGAPAGVDGGGVLATFRFETIGVGSSALSFTDALFLDRDGGDIDVAFQPAQFSVLDDVVVPPGEVPEPASFLLLGAGLAGVAALRRRQRPAQA